MMPRLTELGWFGHGKTINISALTGFSCATRVHLISARQVGAAGGVPTASSVRGIIVCGIKSEAFLQRSHSPDPHSADNSVPPHGWQGGQSSARHRLERERPALPRRRARRDAPDHRGAECLTTSLTPARTRSFPLARSCGPSAQAEFLSRFPKPLKSPHGEGESSSVSLRSVRSFVAQAFGERGGASGGTGFSLLNL